MNRRTQAPNKESRPSMELMTKRQQEADKKEGHPVSHSHVTTWARIASQPPARPIPRKTSAPSSLPSSQADQPQSALEQVSRKKRKKKKPKKANDEAQGENCDAPSPEQRPPQFQDEGEFPELGQASASPFRGLSNTTNLFYYSSVTKRHPESSKESAPHRDTGESHLNKLRQPTPASTKLKEQTPAPTTRPPPAPATDAKKGQKAEKSSGKKSKAPVQLDLGSMLAVLEQKQQAPESRQDAKPVILSVGGALPVVPKDPSAQKKHPRQQQLVAHNPLDSTSPLVKKGKQREVPKAKKPTPLKRIILKEREERKQNRLLEEQGLLPPAEESGPSGPGEDLQETTAAEEELCGLTGASSQIEDAQNTELCEAAPPEDADADPERDTEETAEDRVPQEATLPCRPKIHSRKFRDYCSQMLSKEVDECVSVLLKELVRFQDRLYQKDPMKARMKRRLVMGLREVLKHLKLRKVKCVIISPNCERIQSKGGLDEALHNIIETCREQSVPFVFALSRKALGRCVNKAVPVSLVGIFNYDGAQDHYHKMIELSSQARKAYEVMIANLEISAEEEQKIPAEEQSLESAVSPAESEEPEYIKIWKKMLEKDCNHQLLNFEKQLATVCEAIDSGLQMEEEEGS